MFDGDCKQITNTDTLYLTYGQVDTSPVQLKGNSSTFFLHNQSILLHCVMNGLIENHVQKEVVFPSVTAGSSPKWFTQHGPLNLQGVKAKGCKKTKLQTVLIFSSFKIN